MPVRSHSTVPHGGGEGVVRVIVWSESMVEQQRLRPLPPWPSPQYGYNSNWWARPACFDDYFDADGEPPVQLASGLAPFAMHFNGPAGRFRLGWCIGAFLQRCSREGQHYIDLDDGGKRVALPMFCDGDTAEGAAADAARRQKGAEAPTGHVPLSVSRPCTSRAQTRVRCINDRCFTFH